MKNEKMAKVYEMLDVAYEESHGDRDIKDLTVSAIIDSIHHEIHREEIDVAFKKRMEAEKLLCKAGSALHGADGMIDKLTDGPASKEMTYFVELFHTALEAFDQAMNIRGVL